MANRSPVFLGFDRPPLDSAVDWFFQQFSAKAAGRNQLDLSSLIVVVPTRRVRVRLLQRLVDRANDQQLDFSPPTITTLGQFPEYLYQAKKSLASDLTQLLAWTKALEATPTPQLKALTGLPEIDPDRDWTPIAQMLSTLHTRLANDIWSFHSVAREVKKDQGFLKEEAARWEALSEIQRRYYAILESVDLWDKQAARNYAAAGLLKADEIRCSTSRSIVMLGTADLNRSVSEMLRQIKTTDPQKVHVLIAAPETLANRFDEFGSLITSQWIDAPISLSDDQMVIVDRPADQAHAAVSFVNRREPPVAADQITIGIPDETIASQLERLLDSLDLKHRNLAGKRVAEMAPVQMLVAIGEFLDTSSYDSLAALVRHPDVFQWIGKQLESEEWLSDLVWYQNGNLPDKIQLEQELPFGDPAAIEKDFDPSDPASQSRAKWFAQRVARLNQMAEQIVRLLQPLSGDARPIAQWCDRWHEVLFTIFDGRELDPNNLSDQQIMDGCQAISDAFNKQTDVPPQFELITGAVEALEWALQETTDHRVVAPPAPDAIELAGWLDLILDDAPVMAITGMNDENVPSSEAGHPFLPNELCKQLQILDNDRRFARDRYALQVIASVRNDLLLIVGRRTEQGDPLKPSRLLFADQPQVAARRAKAFFDYAGKPASPFWLHPQADCRKEQALVIPEPITPSGINKISVTKFKQYIQCPYRFYLKHILRLESVDDSGRELDGGLFGDLAHNVMEAFGRDKICDSTSTDAILEFLNDQLTTLARQQFGDPQLPAVRIQIDQLRLRFEQFVPHQVAHRQDGWRIVSTEEMLEHDFDVDGTPFCIRGKIDRVDQHEETGQIAVWDYKTSDSATLPEAAHYASQKKEWKDLQLPLYRHLVKEVDAVKGADFSNVGTGYILLPKKLEATGFEPTTWDAETLETADETARAIIRKLRAGIFWPPAATPPLYSSETAAICQDRVFEPFNISSPSSSPSKSNEVSA